MHKLKYKGTALGLRKYLHGITMHIIDTEDYRNNPDMGLNFSASREDHNGATSDWEYRHENNEVERALGN